MRGGSLRILVAVVGIVLILATAARVRVFRSDQRIWTEAAQQSPAKPGPWINLGAVYHAQNAEALAEDAYVRAIELAQQPTRTPDEQIGARAVAEANLAVLEWQAGRRPAAARLIVAAHDRVPHNQDVTQLYTWILAHP